MPEKTKEGKSPKAHREKEKEKEKQKIAQEMSATITSLRKKSEDVKKARELAWETGEAKDKETEKKAKATLYEDMKGVTRVQNRAKKVGLDTERLERTQVEANEAYLDKGRGKDAQRAGKKSKGFENDYEVGEGAPKDKEGKKGYATRSKATDRMDWPKGMGQETPVREGRRSRSPSPVSTPEPSYDRPPPPRKKDGKFSKKGKKPEIQTKNAFEVLMGKRKEKEGGEEKGEKTKSQADGSKASSESKSKKSSATSRAEQEINREREDEQAKDLVEQSVHDREVRSKEDEVEDLERQLVAKKAEIQRRKERREREEKEKEKVRKEKEKIRKNKLQRAKEADERSSERESRRSVGDEEDIVEVQAPGPKKANKPPQEQDANRTAKWVADSINREQARKSDEERISELAKAAVAAVQASEAGKEERRQQTGPSRLEALKVVERKRPEVKFEARGKQVDFESHMRAFLRTMKVEGLAYADKLVEMKFWFGSTAYLRVASYMRRDDAETAFDEAVARLRKEYGEKRDTAEDMIASLTSGEAIKSQDHEAIAEFTLKLEEVFSLAVETDRDDDFNREAIYKRILTSKLPFLLNKWAWHLTKRRLKNPKFEDLMSFLSQNMEATELMKEYDPGTNRTKTSRKPVSAEEKKTGNSRNGGGWQTVGAKQKENIGQRLTELSGTPRSTAPPTAGAGQETNGQEQARSMPKCELCPESHWLDLCGKFRDMKPDEKVEYLRNANRCLKCTRTHRTQNCRFSYACKKCPEIHATVMHEALQDEATLLEALIDEEEEEEQA